MKIKGCNYGKIGLEKFFVIFNDLAKLCLDRSKGFAWAPYKTLPFLIKKTFFFHFVFLSP